MKNTSPRKLIISLMLLFIFGYSVKSQVKNPDLMNSINQQWSSYQNYSQGNPCFWKTNDSLVKSINLFAKSTIQQNGFPGNSLVGGQSSEYFANILSLPFINPDILNKGLASMKERVLEKDADPNTFARIYDILYYNKNGKQVYGTMVSLNCENCKTEDKKFVSTPIEDSINVDVRRKAIGLSSINDYMEKLKATFTYTPVSDIKVQNPCSVQNR